MGWIISVGKAGAKGRAAGAQALSLHIDAPGMAAQVRVCPHVDRTPSGDANSMPAWQAQRVWNLVSALVGP